MPSQPEKNINKIDTTAESLSKKAESEQKKVELTTKAELAPLGSKVEMDILSKQIEKDAKPTIDIETNFTDLSFDKVPTLPEEKNKFELFQKETFILLHQLVALDDKVMTPEDLKLKAGGLFFDPAFQEHYMLSEKAKGLYSKLQTLYGYLLSGTDAQKQNARLIFDQWNELIGQIQTGVGFAGKIKNNPDILQKKEVTLPPKEKNLWDKIVENKNSILTTAAVGLGVFGAVKFISSLFGGKKEEKTDGGGFWKWLLGGGAVLGAVGLTFLSGKNPLEMVSSLLGGETLKVILESTLKPIIGDELTTLLSTKLDGKITPAEFSDAYKKDGLKGIGKLILDKKIEFSEEEWKKISEKFGLPDFSGVKQMWEKLKEKTSSTVENSTSDATQEKQKEGIVYEKFPVAMENYKNNIKDGFRPIAKYIKDNQTAAKLAVIWLASSNIKLIGGLTIESAEFSLDAALSLSKLPFKSKGSFSLASFFGLSSLLIYKSKAYENIMLPKDKNELKKWLKTQIDDKANKEWLREHGIDIPDSELDVAAGILSGEKKLKDYIGSAEEVVGETTKKTINWLELNPEEVIRNKNLGGLSSFADALDIMQHEPGGNMAVYQKSIDEIKKIKIDLTNEHPITNTQIQNLQRLVLEADPGISIYAENGYYMWRRNNTEGVMTEYGTLCIDPVLDAAQATKKAISFVNKDSWENIPSVVEMKVTEWRLMFKNIHDKWREDETMESFFLRCFLHGGQVSFIGGQAVLCAYGEKFILGPVNLVKQLWKGIFDREHFSAVEAVHEYANGLVPVLTITLTTSIAKGIINPFNGKGVVVPLIKSAFYPLTGGIKTLNFAFTNIGVPILKGDLRGIIENPRNKIRADFFNKWHGAIEYYENINNKLPFANIQTKEIASTRSVLKGLYEALYNIKEAERKFITQGKAYKAAENILIDIGRKDVILQDLLTNIDDSSVKQVLERIELAIKKENELLRLRTELRSFTSKKGFDTVIADAKQTEINTISKKTLEKYKVHLDTIHAPTASPHVHANLKTKVDALGWKASDFDAEPMETKRYDFLKGIINTLSETELKIQEQLKHAESIPDKALRKEAINKIQKELIAPFTRQKSFAMQLVLKKYKELPVSGRNLLKVHIIDYMKSNDTTLGKVLRISKGRGIFMFAQAAMSLGVQEGIKQYSDPERDLFDFFSHFFEENMQYETLQILVDILPFAGTYSNFHASVTGKQLVYQAASLIKGEEVKPSVEVSDTMSRVSNFLWGTAGLAGDIITVLSALPSAGSSIPVNLSARLGVIALKTGKEAKIAKYLLEEMPRLTKIADKIEGGWKTVFSKLFEYFSSSASSVLKTAGKMERPLFIGAATATAGTILTGYTAGPEIDIPEDIAKELDGVEEITIAKK